MNRVTVILAALFSSITLAAQNLVFNQGAIHILPNAIVQINGGIENDGATTVFNNNGTVTVSNSNAFPFGDFMIDNGATSQGNGLYEIEHDWINNATFTSGTSYVELYGADQLIDGSAITTFYDLELTGTGVKTQTVNAAVSNRLMLNDRELATDVNTMFVTNTATLAISNDQTFGAEGFVSSLGSGSLSRNTASANVYRYPVGSSFGTARYREVELRPASAAANTYTVRLANNNPGLDGMPRSDLDSSLCDVNEFFYHKINRTAGTDAADVHIEYDEATDGKFDALAQWNAPQANVWNDIGPVTQQSSLYSSWTASAWNNFTEENFALGRKGPVIADFDTITGGFFTDEISFNDNSTGATSWSWDFGDGSTSTSQDPKHEYTNPGNYTITLVVTNDVGCADTTTLTLSIAEGIIIPNVFSPNADGINDVFRIPALGMSEFKVSIYNRWGQLLFESSEPEIVWDGRTFAGEQVPVGTYYFILTAVSPNKDYSTTGYLTLVR